MLPTVLVRLTSEGQGMGGGTVNSVGDPASELAAGQRRGRSRRPVLLIVVVLLVALVAVAVWIAVGVLDAARVAKQAASRAQVAITVAKQALESGDTTKAQDQVAVATSSLGQARTAVDIPQLHLLGVIPVVRQPVDDMYALLGAADDVSAAAAGLVRVYGMASGSSPGSTPLLQAGAVDLDALRLLGTDVEQVRTQLSSATRQLDEVAGTFPGTGELAQARDDALAQIRPLQEQVDALAPAVQALPDALGAATPRRYLVTLLNPAELRTTGGAPLTVAVLSFDRGRLTIPVRSTTSKLFTSQALLAWDRVAGPPFGKLPTQPDRFVNANAHPDWRISAEDLRRAWVVNGQQPVDGVVALDATALSALLRVTGPVQSAGYGTINADNLGQKLLVDSYLRFADDQSVRQSLNEQLLDTVTTRLTSGDSLIEVLRAFGGVASGRHVQAYFADDALQHAVEAADAAGAIAMPESGDRIAAYTTNTNGSKVDVFQQRTIAQVVRLQADGGATITRTVRVVNDVPGGAAAASPTDSRYFYTTRWARAGFYVYLPTGATVTAAGGSWPVNPRIWSDGEGGELIRTAGWVSPGAQADVRVTYTVPAGTFGRAETLAYTAVVEPQPMYRTPTLDLTVVPPAGMSVQAAPEGWTATSTGWTLRRPIDDRFTVTLPVG